MVSPEVEAQLKLFDVKPLRLLITPAVLLPLTLIAAGLRFYVKGRIMRAFALDDWLLLVAIIAQTIDSAVYIKYSQLQLDQGIIAVEGLLGQLIITGECLYLVEQIFLKASMGVYFLRIIREKWQTRTILISLAIYEVYTIAFLFCAIFSFGLPTAHHILEQSKAPHAIPVTVFRPINYIYAAFNIIIDFIFTFIPMFVVAKAMIPLRAKVSVCVLILLGAVGSMVSVARIYFLPAITEKFSFSGIEMLGTISLAESSAGMIAISLATLRPLFKSCIDRVSSSKGSKYATTENKTYGQTGISKRTEVAMVESIDADRVAEPESKFEV